jgi:hypothetical protein
MWLVCCIADWQMACLRVKEGGSHPARIINALERISHMTAGHKTPASRKPTTIPTFRSSPPISSLLNNLGPLKELPGTWSGGGFNLIARPDHEGGNDIFLELNLTEETLTFDLIGAPIPNRGTGQNDIELFGIHYLQQINDATTKGALHLEPGIWINVPATTVPVETQSVARMASIPHGNALLAEGQGTKIVGPPTPGFANTVPFPVGTETPKPGTPNGFPEYNLSAPNPFRTSPLPAAITQAVVTNPNSFLANAIAGQTITETEVLDIATVSSLTIGPPPTVVPIPNGGGGVENIPFLVSNANAAQVFATFWIEKVKHPHGPGHFLQLQYTQTVLLNFLGLSWPHVSVATLVKH